MRRCFLFVCLLCSIGLRIGAQNELFKVEGYVVDASTMKPLIGANIFIQETKLGTNTNNDGFFSLTDLLNSSYTLEVSYIGKTTILEKIDIDNRDLLLNIKLSDDNTLLSEIVINDNNESEAIQRLRAVENSAIYSSKKNELVLLDKLTINKASNLSRQIYSRVSGLNIWESDGAGVQLGIGGRGLSPNRSSNFNTRQSGYDISADALGYPESYYTPPAEAIDKIEVIRGAASLQYGTQFGGLINFRFKEGPKDDKIELNSRLTMASFDFLNVFNSVGGTVGKLSYYGFHQYKRSGGWRPNASLDQHNGFVSALMRLSKDFEVKVEYTHSNYLAQQPGGVTDAEFELNPRQSKRSRNWFAVDWNLIAAEINYSISDRLKWNNRTFGLIAGRDALGNLDNINLLDFGQNRDFLNDDFNNWGNESRILWRYNTNDQPSTLLVGMRYYRGRTFRRQGDGSDGSDADFRYLNPDNLEGSDFVLPSRNISLFAENLFNLNQQWSLTPGIRYENILTESDGYYREITKDLANNIINDVRFDESKKNDRSFVFFGVGTSFKPSPSIEIYANVSQNYRAINFNDIRVTVGSLVVDEELKDERGFTVDLGFRGNVDQVLAFDYSIYRIAYNDRIGTILRREPNPVFNGLVDRIVRFRTNVADATIYGFESLMDLDVLRLLGPSQSSHGLNLYTNLSWTHATYASDDSTIDGNEVELVPTVTFRTGINYSYKAFSTSIQYAHTAEHFSDASNAIRTPTAIEGLIPSYYVADFSLAYRFDRFTLEAGVNNLTNHLYFTRRATGYPGPGIIPSDGRSLYLTVGFRL